ncbi:hypothetical protein GVO57_09520 [Sphingomonas changnyeongensis]|uniref:HTH luxR-type domain-containing protein n=1 Tax=Sphingomonas changnyeongensis TaxID=2698679 RepID=A0A7Z2NX74_9SPHN|nr:LuxR C-terminal-related transcriptional regulator [Sphingomonas changnyeongensis]QHL91015.1 hypothetical protein GVO57_09520 [Sphingomonas changnyeongensis]
MTDFLRRLNGAALRSAHNPDLWEDLVQSVLEFFGVRGAALAICDLDSMAFIHAMMCGFPLTSEQIWSRYTNELRHTDFHPELLARLPDGSVYTDADAFPAEDRRSPAVIAWLERKLGVRHQLSLVVKEGRHAASLQLHRARADGPFNDADRRVMQMIAAEIDTSLKISLRHAADVLRSYWNGLSAHGTRSICLLDDQARVLMATDAFMRDLAETGQLHVRNGRLGATRVIVQARISEALERTAAGLRTVPVIVSRTPRDPSWVAAASFAPLPAARETVFLNRAVALVSLEMQRRDSSHVAETLIDSFGLTPQEARIAVMVGFGSNLTNIAADLDITRETARTHLKRIFQKMGLRRQADLIQLTSRLLRP